MTLERYACASPGCRMSFTSSGAASLHYAEQHLGHDPAPTRPVSCWRCAAYIPTTRNADGTVEFGACSECGFVHPQARQPTIPRVPTGAVHPCASTSSSPPGSPPASP